MLNNKPSNKWLKSILLSVASEKDVIVAIDKLKLIVGNSKSNDAKQLLKTAESLKRSLGRK
jgi:ATP-dependent Clp protease ATP-binding subunit ClpA